MTIPGEGSEQPTEQIPRVDARVYPAPQPGAEVGPGPAAQSGPQSWGPPAQGPPTQGPTAQHRQNPQGSEDPTVVGRAPVEERREPTPTTIMPALRFDAAGGAAPQDGPDGAAPGAEGTAVDGRAVRFLTATAGLLSAGVLLLGIAMLVMKFVVPAMRSGTGLDESYGPGTGQIIAQLLVGAAGESTRLLRRRSVGAGVRGAAAVAVILGVLVVLWWSWWS